MPHDWYCCVLHVCLRVRVCLVLLVQVKEEKHVGFKSPPRRRGSMRFLCLFGLML